MKHSTFYLGVIAVLALAGCSNSDLTTKTASSIDFMSMFAPATDNQARSNFNDAQLETSINDGRSETNILEYKHLFIITGSNNGKTVGQPLMDSSVPGDTIRSVSDTADAKSMASLYGADEFMITHSPQYLESYVNSERGRAM